VTLLQATRRLRELAGTDTARIDVGCIICADRRSFAPDNENIEVQWWTTGRQRSASFPSLESALADAERVLRPDARPVEDVEVGE
jgi:hypothetical protein